MLLVLHWYCYLYVLVLCILLVHWYQSLFVSVLICYWYHTGAALYMYWYCGYCWYTGNSHPISLYQYVTGTALVLLFICTGTVGTVGTLVPATLCLCAPYVTGTTLVLLFYMYWYCECCWYIGTGHSMSLYQYVTGTVLVLLFRCTGALGTVGTLVPATLCLCTNMLLVVHWYCCLYVLVLWVLLVHWYQSLYVCVPICYWYHTDAALYMYWYCGYCGYCWYTGTSHSISLYQYVTGTALVLLFICTGTVGTVGTLVPAALCLCAYMLLVPHWYCYLYVLVL